MAPYGYHTAAVRKILIDTGRTMHVAELATAIGTDTRVISNSIQALIRAGEPVVRPRRGYAQYLTDAATVPTPVVYASAHIRAQIDHLTDHLFEGLNGITAAINDQTRILKQIADDGITLR